MNPCANKESTVCQTAGEQGRNLLGKEKPKNRKPKGSQDVCVLGNQKMFTPQDSQTPNFHPSEALDHYCSSMEVFEAGNPVTV